MYGPVGLCKVLNDSVLKVIFRNVTTLKNWSQVMCGYKS